MNIDEVTPGALPSRDERTGPVVLVEDDPTARLTMRRWLEEAGYQITEHDRGQDAIAAVTTEPLVVCLDLGLGDMSGIDVLRHIQTRDPNVPIVVVTAQDDAVTAVNALKSGAYDYLVKPLDRERLLHAVQRAAERHELKRSVERLRSVLGEQQLLRSVVGQSAPMRELAQQVERVLDSDVAVAIYGESGTGKELIARAIHGGGRRQKGPFIAVNCASIPESLHESELFGHERGAFTGAISVHRGRFEQADKGTLFLDEIGEMGTATQASLLRTLQERTLRRVGGTSEIPVDVRIICATNRELSSEVKAGRFREDLYYRLVVFPIRIPPLRDRPVDIPLLVAHFLNKYRADVGREVPRVSSDALEALTRYSWPGNVRELENAIHRGMLSSDGDELGLAHLPPDVRASILPRLAEVPPRELRREPNGSEGTILPLRELERRAIRDALRASGGSVGKAAKLLGMGRATLYRRLADEGGLLGDPSHKNGA